MKKFGFTLSEVIIALAVVGVIAAISAPILGNMMPDNNKAKVLKAYKTISDITRDLLDDPKMYRDYISASSNYTNAYIGLASNCSGITGEYPIAYPYLVEKYGNKAFGAKKYPFLFSEKLELQGAGTFNAAKSYFTTIDGIRWDFYGGSNTPSGETTSGKRYITGYTITIDLNGAIKPNANFSATQKKPDRFIFRVDTYGNVTAGDALTAAYLENPDKLNDKKKDYARAKDLLSEY